MKEGWYIRFVVCPAVVFLALVLAAGRPSRADAYDPVGSWIDSIQNYGYDTFDNLNGVSSSDARTQIDAAALTWSTAASPWKVQRAPSAYAIHVRTCLFGTMNSCEPNQPVNGPAVVDPSFSSGYLSSETMSFNTSTSITWTTNCSGPNGLLDVQTTALHEFGHTVYLRDLYTGGYFNPPDAIMGWNVGNQGCKRTLGQDDLDGLHAVYGQRYYVSSIFNNWNGWNGTDPPWSSTITVASESDISNVVIRFYGSTAYDPNKVYTTTPIQVSPGTPLNFQANVFLSGLGAPAGIYGATVDSDRSISVVHKSFISGDTVADGTGQVEPYLQQTTTSAQVVSPIPYGSQCPNSVQTMTYIPLVMNNNHGWSTQVSVQDVGPTLCSGSNRFTLYYYDTYGNFTGYSRVSLGEDRVAFVPQLGSSAPTVGSAYLVTPDNVAVTVEEMKSPMTSLLFFKGFNINSAKSTNFLPLIQNNNHGWSSGIAVQNLGSSTTTVTLNINGTTWTSGAINPKASITIYPLPITNFTVAGGYVQSNSGQPIATVVNQITSTTNQGSTYSGFSSGSTVIDLPSVTNNYSDAGSWTTWTSGVMVQNVGGTSNCFGLWINNGWQYFVTLAPYQSYTWYPVPGVPAGSQISTMVGGCNGALGVAVVNNFDPSGAGNDGFYTYDGGIR